MTQSRSWPADPRDPKIWRRRSMSTARPVAGTDRIRAITSRKEPPCPDLLGEGAVAASAPQPEQSDRAVPALATLTGQEGPPLPAPHLFGIRPPIPAPFQFLGSCERRPSCLRDRPQGRPTRSRAGQSPLNTHSSPALMRAGHPTAQPSEAMAPPSQKAPRHSEAATLPEGTFATEYTQPTREAIPQHLSVQIRIERQRACWRRPNLRPKRRTKTGPRFVLSSLPQLGS